MQLDKNAKEDLARKCWRSHSEFCRIFLPDWFPTKMPWVHRGLAALMTGQTEFLLDFGPEIWRDEVAAWTPHDLEKILTNFVVVLERGKYAEDGSVIVPEVTRPIFSLQADADGKFSIKIDQNEFTAAILPRGFSKTTLVNSVNLRDIEYNFLDFFLYVSESGPHAERQLGTIKKELEENDLLREVFGDIVAGRQSTLKWTDKYIEPTNGVMVGAAGRGGQVRGFGKSAKRPARIVADDLEDTESVESDTQRKKDAHWFFNTLIPARRKGGQIFVIGTLLHSDAILNKCEKDPRFTYVRFGAIDRQGDPLWPFMMDEGEIEKQKSASAIVGELPGFYLEYMSELRDDQSRVFPLNKLIYQHRDVERMVGLSLVMDPAISQAKGADFCAFAVVGIEAGGHKHCLDYYGKQGMDPSEQIEKYFELHFKWMTKVPAEHRRHGIEAIAYQRALLHFVHTAQFQHTAKYGYDAHFEVIPIFHGQVSKDTRIKGIMKPLIHAGYFSFEQRWPDLETMFEEFPSGKKDGPDVVAMAVGLLDPFASLNLGVDYDPTADTAVPLEQLLGENYLSAP